MTQAEENHNVIAQYRSQAASDHWDAIANFVRTIVTLLVAEHKAVVVNALTAVSLYAHWAFERGLPLDEPADVFHPAMLYRYSSEKLDSKASIYRDNHLRTLRRLMALLEDPAPDYPRKPLRRRPIPATGPFTASEQAAFVSSSNTRNTEWQRSNMRVLLGLGFGAGLTAEELNHARAADIRRAGEHLVVDTHGKNARTIPVRHDWAPILLRGLATREPEDYAILGYRHETISARLMVEMHVAAPHEPHPTPNRMRTTWIVEHLTRGVRPDIVAAIAGLGDITSLRNYILRMPAYDLSDYTSLIVGGAE